jgi:LmbE family N-acetylglucosaminyl deacetylase
VTVLVAADGRSSHRSAVLGPGDLAAVRAAEVTAACATLGVDAGDLVQLGFHDGSLAARVDDVAAHIDDVLLRTEPEEVLVPSSRDWHVDHRSLNEALRRVVRRRRRRPRVLEYPVWYWVHGPWEADPDGPWPDRRPRQLAAGWLRSGAALAELVSTTGHLEQKRRALACHASQTTNLTGEAGWALLDDEFVASFLLPAEPFFPAEPG